MLAESMAIRRQPGDCRLCVGSFLPLEVGGSAGWDTELRQVWLGRRGSQASGRGGSGWEASGWHPGAGAAEVTEAGSQELVQEGRAQGCFVDAPQEEIRVYTHLCSQNAWGHRCGLKLHLSLGVLQGLSQGSISGASRIPESGCVRWHCICTELKHSFLYPCSGLYVP
jgi:hypothetical protein